MARQPRLTMEIDTLSTLCMHRYTVGVRRISPPPFFSHGSLPSFSFVTCSKPSGETGLKTGEKKSLK